MVPVAESTRVKERRTDPRRRIAVEVALALADTNAGWGDYERALEHLAAADQLTGGALSPRITSLRDSWIREASGSH
jgi:hypothetical protein